MPGVLHSHNALDVSLKTAMDYTSLHGSVYMTHPGRQASAQTQIINKQALALGDPISGMKCRRPFPRRPTDRSEHQRGSAGRPKPKGDGLLGTVREARLPREGLTKGSAVGKRPLVAVSEEMCVRDLWARL